MKKVLLAVLIVGFYGGLIGLYRINHAESEKESEAPIAVSSKITARDDAPPVIELPKDAIAQAGIETKTIHEPPPPLPVGAIVRTDGRAWIYFRLGEGKFARAEVLPESSHETGTWNLVEERPSAEIVSMGAQTLLSEEMKSQISAGDGD